MPSQDAQAVLLLSDIVDSTHWTHKLGEARAAALWTEHDRLARDLLGVWHGREIDKSDGFLLLFERASDALGYASAYHAALAALEPPLTARIGVHAGRVTLRANPPTDVQRGAKPLEVDGASKPLAARIMALARSRQTLLSAAARAAADDPALTFASHGHWQLKGIDEPIELFEFLRPNQPREAPADGDKGWRVVQHQGQWMPVSDRPHSLPAERDRFIGRQAALSELAGRLERGTRLVSIVGPGGTGKTRLGVRAGWMARGENPGGVWFCDLSHARDSDGIVHAMAQGLQLALSGPDPLGQIGEALSGRSRCLVIVDNFEQVTRHAETTLGAWLDCAPHARFLVTTREVLGIVGEDVLALPPLPADEGHALFIERVRAAGAPQWLPHDEQAIAPLVRLLDGLPLAIELAASRSRVLSPAQLLSRMTERFKLLTSAHSRHDRQATLRATLDWSWDLLNETERSALAQLSAFEGGLSIAAAEAVVDLSACDADAWVIDVVQSLVQKSLVRHTADDRFGLLRTVQDYAAAKLASMPAADGMSARDAAWRRHAAHFGALEESAAAQHDSIESDNLVTACRRMLELGDVAAAVRVLVPAWAAVKLIGPFSTGVDLADAVLRSVDAPALRTPALWVRGSARYLLGDAPSARDDLEAAWAGSDEGSLMRARITCALAEVESTFGDTVQAARLFGDALVLARRLHDGARQCQALNGLGTLAAEQSRSAEACALYEQGLAVARACGELRWEGGLLGNLGTVRHVLGDVEASRQHYERALECARAVGDRHFEGNTQCNLGLLLLQLDLPEQALPHLEAALDVARSLGHVRLIGEVLCNLGLLNEQQGRPAAALELHASAVEAAQRHGDRRTEGQYRIYLGRLLARVGRLDEARSCLQSGESLLPAADALTVGLLLCARAEMEHLSGNSDVAAHLVRQAREHGARLHADPASELGRELMRLEARVAVSATR
jgi:predicted ATPase/class 3 adenylate cyclase